MDSRSRLLWIFGIFLLVVSQVVLADNEKFVLNKGEPKKTALVTSSKLVLAVNCGPETDYAAERKFSIKIGGYAIDLVANYIKKAGIVFEYKSNGKSMILLNLVKIDILPGSFKLFPGLGEQINGNITFTELDDESKGNYTLPIELSGDVPDGFELSAEDVGVYNDPSSLGATGAPAANSANAGLIAGIVISVIFAIALIAGGAGYAYYRFVYKPKKLREGGATNDNNKKNPDGKNANGAVATSPVKGKSDMEKGKSIEDHPPTDTDKIWDEYVADVQQRTKQASNA